MTNQSYTLGPRFCPSVTKKRCGSLCYVNIIINMSQHLDKHHLMFWHLLEIQLTFFFWKFSFLFLLLEKNVENRRFWGNSRLVGGEEERCPHQNWQSELYIKRTGTFKPTCAHMYIDSASTNCTVEHEMFACMKYSRFSRILRIRELFMHVNSHL